jgi:hypothetical protein
MSASASMAQQSGRRLRSAMSLENRLRDLGLRTRRSASALRSPASAQQGPAMSLVAPNHSMTLPLLSSRGTVREKVQPIVPSGRRTGCSNSKVVLVRTVCAIASRTFWCASSATQFSNQVKLGSDVSARKLALFSRSANMWLSDPRRG